MLTMSLLRYLRSHYWLAVVFAIIWAFGALVVYSYLPTEPRLVLPTLRGHRGHATTDGLRYMESRIVKKYVHGGRLSIYVTCGPIRIWNTQTGPLVAEHLTEADEFDELEMPGDRIRISSAPYGESSESRRDYFLDLQSGEMTPAPNRPAFGQPHCMHPDSIFVVCSAVRPRTGLDWVDVETGEVIRAFPNAWAGFVWTTDRRHYAYKSGAGMVICRANDHSILYKFTCKERPRQLSVKAGVLVDNECKVWDMASGEVLWRDSSNTRMASDLRFIADESALVWRKSLDPCGIVHIDPRTGQEIASKSFRLPLTEKHPFNDRAGANWIACTNILKTATRSVWQRSLERLPIIGQRIGNQNLFLSVLVDSNTLTEFFRCPGSVLSVSGDRKTVISYHPDGTAVWDVPARPSWQTASIVIIGWTGLWLVASFALMGIVTTAQYIWRSSGR